MSRAEFLKQLEEELMGIPAEERAGAIQYYEEYFDDAGPEHENDVLEHLGSVVKIAEDIKKSSFSESGDGWTPPEKPEKKKKQAAAVKQEPAADGPVLTLNPEPLRYWESTEEDNSSEAAVEKQEPVWEKTAEPGYPPRPERDRPYKSTGHTSRIDPIKLIIVIFAAVICWPVLVGLLIAFVSIAVVPFILCISFCVALISIIVAGVGVVGLGLGGTLIYIGAAIAFLGLTLLSGYLGVRIFSKIVPKVFNLFKKLLSKTANVAREA